MRGKTNVPPRLKPVINGDVRNFVVASGNTIAKGDFVSYVLNSQYTPFDSRTMTLVYKEEYDNVNHKYVLVFDVANSSPIIMLIQVSQGDLVVLDNYTVELSEGNGIHGAFVDGSYIYICDAPSSVSMGAKTVIAKKFEIVNDAVTFVQDYSQTITVSGSSYSGIVIGLAVKGSKVYIAVDYINSSGSTGSSSVRIFYGELGDDIPYNQYISSSGGGTKNSIVICTPYSFGTKLVFVDMVSGYGGRITIVDPTDNTIVNVESVAGFSVCDRFDSKICLASSTVAFYEIVNDEIVTLYNNSFVNYNSLMAVGRIEENKFVVLFTNPQKTLLFDFGETVQVTENSLNVIATPKESFNCILSDYNGHVLLDCTNAYGVVKYFGNVDETNGFVIGEPTNYVQSYNGSFTVGFAKTGGTAGDTIQVYVPHNS